MKRTGAAAYGGVAVSLEHPVVDLWTCTLLCASWSYIVVTDENTRTVSVRADRERQVLRGTAMIVCQVQRPGGLLFGFICVANEREGALRG